MVFWREGGFSSTLQGAAGWWGERRKLGRMLSARLDEEGIMEGLQRTSRTQRHRGVIPRPHVWNLPWATDLGNTLNILT